MTASPVLKWPGAKWRIARWIVAQLPPHRVYLEPFAGSAAVFFTKAPSKLETINDLDGGVVNFYRVLRDQPLALARAVELTPYARGEFDACWAEPATGDPVEDARRFLVRIWGNHGMRVQRKGGWAHTSGKAASVQGGNIAIRAEQWANVPARIAAATRRLREVQVEQRPALDLLARYDHRDCLVYADPPYVLSTRGEKQYNHEMTDADHRALLAALAAHPGPVVLSGYPCALYDEALAGWRRIERVTLAEAGAARTEVLWLNAAAVVPQLFDNVAD